MASSKVAIWGKGFGIACGAGFTAAIVGCSTITKAVELFQDPAPRAAPAASPALYRQGLIQLEQEDNKGALQSFDEFLTKYPTSAYTQVALFNGARALEGLEQWRDAAERYRAVIKNTARAPRLQALALYRLSFCHEALGEDPQTVAALIDARNRIRDLPMEIASAELPARLAVAYARVGGTNEAMRYYSEAEAGISRLRNQATTRQVPEWLPSTLYQMGRMSLRKITRDDFETALRPIGKAQFYLVQAAELEADPWSERATRELTHVYDEIWNVIEANPVVPEDEDPIAFERAVQNRRWEMAELALTSLRGLRTARPPTERSNSVHLKAIFDYVDELEKKLLAVFDVPPAGTGLTPEARARQERVRGRVIAPSDFLEREYMKTNKPLQDRLPGKKTKTKKSESVSKQAPRQDARDAEDPNL